MKLFLLTQKRMEYDTAQSIVVWAESAGEARRVAQEPVRARKLDDLRASVWERSWAPKDAFCTEVPLADYPKVVHVYFRHG